MPTYEMPLLLRIMKKPEVIATLKRTSQAIFNTGGFIRKLENWGVKQLPCKIKTHRHTHHEASFFLVYFDMPPQEINKFIDECHRDIDIVRIRIFAQNILTKKKECTFHEEMLPPMHRPNVQKLIELAKKQESNKHKFKYNTGLDYYPFNK